MRRSICIWTPPTVAKSTNGTGISPAAPDHSEKRSTSFTAVARRPSEDVSVTSGEVGIFAIIASGSPFEAREATGRPGVVGSGTAALGKEPAPLKSAAPGMIARGSFFLFTVTPLA
jgi:hypothetical protein